MIPFFLPKHTLRLLWILLPQPPEHCSSACASLYVYINAAVSSLFPAAFNLLSRPLQYIVYTAAKVILQNYSWIISPHC